MNVKTDRNPTMVCIQRAGYSKIDINGLMVPLGGINRFVSSGDRVVLKVNLLSASTPGSAVITHPAVVKSVAEAVLAAGGKPVIADSPSREFSRRRLDKVYDYAELKPIAKELGIELNYDTGSKIVKVTNGKRLKKVPIANYIHKADKIIALPKLKTHSLMIMTLATKIMYGAVPGLTKARFHSMYFTKKAFSDMLLDVLSVTKPNLFIMDGITAMQGDGPFSGEPVELKVLLAATDAIALDLAVCDIINIEPIGVPILKRAKLHGLWPSKIEYPLLSPHEVEFPGFRLPSTAGYLLTRKEPPRKWPVITAKCTGCGDCQQVCPKKAAKVINEHASIDYDLCIRCYCCHEVCPEKAIKLETK